MVGVSCWFRWVQGSDSRFMVCGLGFRNIRFMVSRLGFGVYGLLLRFRVYGLGFKG